MISTRAHARKAGPSRGQWPFDHASPLVGSTVASAPREVSLTFTQNLESSFGSVQVTDANGARVDQGKAQISGNTMRVGLKSLSPGCFCHEAAPAWMLRN
jgi:methionine-rich copper-binding protein CopC